MAGKLTPPTELPAPFSFTSTVIHGEKVGRTINFPTANLADNPSKKDLTQGVYFGTCQLSEATSHFCLVYFGPRYIFGEEKDNFEVYLYDFQGDLYGQSITVNLTHFLRPPLQLPDLNSLKVQLEQDKLLGSELIAHQ